MASKTKEQKAAEAAARAEKAKIAAEKADLERADRIRTLEPLIQSLRSDSENPELTDGERAEAAAGLATAEAELMGLKGTPPEPNPPETKAQAHRVRTTLRFGCPIKGRSKCTLDGSDGPVTVWMEDGLPVESSEPITDADLSKAGFR